MIRGLFFRRMEEGWGTENSNNPLECKSVSCKEAPMGSWPISVGPQESHTHSAGFKDGAMVPECVWAKTQM